jgi:CRISPR/Cas system-associated exonuclease Cas4 (RecB family)
MSDVMQLMTQCVILEDQGNTVTHGVVEYSDKRIPIPYGPEERRKVLQAAEAIRAERRAGTANRSHNEAWRCGACGHRAVCDHRLV